MPVIHIFLRFFIVILHFPKMDIALKWIKPYKTVTIASNVKSVSDYK